MSMFCRQCEQTAKGQGCTVQGVCGKKEPVADLQDLLIYSLVGISIYGQRARELNLKDDRVDRFVIEGLFTAITNVHFDDQRLEKMIYQAYEMKKKIQEQFLTVYAQREKKSFQDFLPDAATWQPQATLESLFEKAKTVGILANSSLDPDIRSLREILLYGLKGMAAYADHAWILGKKDESVNAFFHKGLSSLVNDELTADNLVGLIMEFGQINLRCMEILDEAHNETFGHPEPTEVFCGEKKGPAIIVSGHDLKDLKELLEQSEGSGVNIYTHGEMLPAHGYPELKRHKHLVGHFGTAWQNQQKEFDNIPAVVLITTNCIQKPRDSYFQNIFTTGLVAWPDVTHVNEQEGKKDFTPLIKRALSLKGFAQDSSPETVTVGFAHHAVLGVAEKVLDLIAQKKIRHFFLIGGCDGAKPGRNYYTEFAEKTPKDTIILTLACGKFRINHLQLGDIEGIPRMLDCGQCNDAYSAIKIATALADALKCTVHDLPLSLILSWYEQKAVCILLTLLSLGIKNIRLGPSLPAFVSENVLKILVEKFNIQPISTPQEDLSSALSGR